MDERRTGWLLIVLLVGQLVFLALQGAGDPGTDTVLERTGLRLLGPVARSVAEVPQNLSEAGEGMKLRGQLLEENRRLRQEVESLRLQLLRLSDVDGDLRRLGAAVRYPTPPAGNIRAVDVVYADHASWLRTLVLYTGDQPARPNQPVLAPEGLVGRVVTVAGPYAKVQMITDRAASVGGMVLRTRRQGVVRGGGSGGGGGAVGWGLELDYVPLQADVRPGDRVLTAGIDGVFPRGIPIGTVTAVEQGGQLFHRIRVVPAVDFGTLDQVYLLEREPLPAAVKEAAPGARP
ncbi:MAG TPA: rod shape-determining protein MreC [Thermoanaerobaculia bacterium]|nr:rod shape-determining protein MreC [Thermoanaerobaculia bacterium]